MPTDLPPLPTLPLGRYRHYQGEEYEVLGIVRHSETLAPLVLHRPLRNNSSTWVCPFSQFLEPVLHEGRVQSRFSLLMHSTQVSSEELAATVQRMETRLSSSTSAAVPRLMSHYREVALKFEHDLAASARDIDLAKASALMLIQAAAQSATGP